MHARAPITLWVTIQHAGLPDVLVHGPADDAKRLPNTLSIGIRGVAASQLLSKLSNELAASAGSACHSETSSISAVLQAMQVLVLWFCLVLVLW